jgi:hypothetical protein
MRPMNTARRWLRLKNPGTHENSGDVNTIGWNYQGDEPRLTGFFRLTHQKLVALRVTY